MEDEKKAKLALIKLRKMREKDISDMRKLIEANTKEINELKNKRGLCPQSLVIGV